MDERTQVTDITVTRDAGIHVEFADGYHGDVDLVDLRLQCPCAGCRTDRERDLVPWPKPGSPNPLRITDATLHGAYGVRLDWNDGHGTGIFSWELLRRLSERRD